MKDFFVKLWVSCCFTGYIPIASGTFGTIFGIGMVWITHRFIDISTQPGKVWYAVLTLVLLLVSIPLSTQAEKLFHEKDSSKIVMDEAVSFFVTVFWLPLTPVTIIAGFFLNRFFDIVKIQPARWCQDKLPTGSGVMLDDIIAGIYSYICLRLIIFLTS